MALAPNPIPARVDAATAHANEHARTCAELLKTKGLAAALEYCSSQGIQPPTCSLTADSQNAKRMRKEAGQKLSDSRWWHRRLRTKAVQDFEMEQTRQGRVTNYVSDELLEYRQSSKRRP